MPRVRAGYSGKYKLSKHEFYVVYHYALQYSKWKEEYEALADTLIGLRYDIEKVQTTGEYDPTAAAGERREELSKKMELIEKTAIEADPDIYQYIIKAVTDEHITFNYLKTVMNIPCERDMYYDRRRKFYYLLNKKILCFAV